MAETEFLINQDITTITVGDNGFNIETTINPVIDIITIGEQGPPGTSVVTTYVHDQSSASTTWVINHNLNRYPSGVSVVDSSKRKVLTGVQYINLNTIHVIADNAFAGQAYLN